jgi:hypothetical protein
MNQRTINYSPCGSCGKGVWSRGNPWPLALALLLCWTLIGQAQQLVIRRYDVSDGLAHNTVIAIHQDRQGYLWFGTYEGLSRFDGYRFINYEVADGLGHVMINDIAEDRQGRLWVATNGGGVARLIEAPQVAGGAPRQKSSRRDVERQQS